MELLPVQGDDDDMVYFQLYQYDHDDNHDDNDTYV